MASLFENEIRSPLDFSSGAYLITPASSIHSEAVTTA